MCATKVDQYLSVLQAQHFGRTDGQALARLLAVWDVCVPEPLRTHARPTHCDGRRVLVDADSPIWLSQLRHQTPTVLAALRRQPSLRALESLRGRVRPAMVLGPARPDGRSFTLSARGVAALAALVEDVSDPILKAALVRLLNDGKES